MTAAVPLIYGTRGRKKNVAFHMLMQAASHRHFSIEARLLFFFFVNLALHLLLSSFGTHWLACAQKYLDTKGKRGAGGGISFFMLVIRHRKKVITW